MKDAIVRWDKNIFDGEKRLLPDKERLITQIYGIPEKNDSWSIVFEFKETPRMQGYKSKAKVRFLVDEAPHDILKKGFHFDFMDGPNRIGECEIVENDPIELKDILKKIELIETEKSSFREYVKSLAKEDLIFTHKELSELAMHSNSYPFLFSLILKLDSNIALHYLSKYFLDYPLEGKTVYQSNLPLFFFDIKNEIGEKQLLDFIEKLPEQVKRSDIVIKALDEIL